MKQNYVSSSSLKEISFLSQTPQERVPLSFELELTARCNLDCRHCYINLSAGDRQATQNELSLEEIDALADQAVSLGALWCLITGGEPLLRKDFFDVYKLLKKKGLLLTVFTNACLVTKKHIELFKAYPPRDMEVSVYGVSTQTYERVTRRPGSYAAFRRGLDLLLSNGIEVRLKAMALRSNVHELPEIAEFCRKHTADYFRFDPQLHLRYDRNPQRNAEIRSERLSREEIVAIEQADEERLSSLQKHCDKLIVPEFANATDDQLFHCGAGNNSFTIGCDGHFRLCSSLVNPGSIYNLREGNLADAWFNFVPQVKGQTTTNQDYLENCNKCPIANLCLGCPAHSYLETGYLDVRGEYFCQVAHARAAAIIQENEISILRGE